MKKETVKKPWLLAFVLLSAVLQAQPTFQHIVVLVQENRTPDNLFGSAAIAGNTPIPGADLVPLGGAISLAGTDDPSHQYYAYLTDVTHQNKKRWPSVLQGYVQQSDIGPYLQLATQYGYFNRMFQTNQGPSFPAHQMLFTGAAQSSDDSTAFAIGNESGGCLSEGLVSYLAVDGTQFKGPSCLNPTTFTSLLDAVDVSWMYYAVSSGWMWAAPAAVQSICEPGRSACRGTLWKTHVSFPSTNVLKDISNGTLAEVVWVTPAESYSDHPGSGNNGGPAWVASIVNAIGNSNYWNDTLILVTWDDWGGWYDHVPPLGNISTWNPHGYGFRVPLLMISAYTAPNCIDNNTYDFGSILLAIESNFGITNQTGHADTYSPGNLIYSNCLAIPAFRHFNKVISRGLTAEEFNSTEDADEGSKSFKKHNKR